NEHVAFGGRTLACRSRRVALGDGVAREVRVAQAIIPTDDDTLDGNTKLPRSNDVPGLMNEDVCNRHPAALGRGTHRVPSSSAEGKAPLRVSTSINPGRSHTGSAGAVCAGTMTPPDG